MKERPILFSSAMVRALLDGSKTQTRRIVKLPTSKALEFRWDNARVDRGFTTPIATGQYLHVEFRHPADEWDGCMERVYCPYGQPGDRLWVRETWMDMRGVEGAVGDAMYRATFGNTPEGGRWKPSIHMPRWASRITLEITGVRVERLQDISEQDALAEGVNDRNPKDPHLSGSAFENYAALWESINGPGSWDANPFVWVVEFRRIGGEA